MPSGYGPIVETIHYTGDVLGANSGHGFTGTAADIDHPYPAAWDSGAAETARAGAYAAQAAVTSGARLAYGYERDAYASETITDRFQYLGEYGRILRTLNAGSIPTPDIDPELPPGALFWSWDSETYVIESATLNVTFTGRLTEWNAADGDKPGATEDASTLYVKRATGATYSFGPFTLTGWGGDEGVVLASAPVSRSAGDAPTSAVDVLPYLDTTVAGLIELAIGVDLDDPDPSPTLADDIAGGFHLSGGVTTSVTYGIRMGYRFWYSELPVESEAVIRQYPSTSPSAWGGGPRQHPAPTRRPFGGFQ